MQDPAEIPDSVMARAEKEADIIGAATGRVAVSMMVFRRGRNVSVYPLRDTA